MKPIVSAAQRLRTPQSAGSTTSTLDARSSEIRGLHRAIELANAADRSVSSKSVRVIKYNDPQLLFSLPGLLQSKSSVRSELDMMLELTTPRAYYLASSLPGLSAMRREE